MGAREGGWGKGTRLNVMKGFWKSNTEVCLTARNKEHLSAKTSMIENHIIRTHQKENPKLIFPLCSNWLKLTSLACTLRLYTCYSERRNTKCEVRKLGEVWSR
jgi:hypothetical protein